MRRYHIESLLNVRKLTAARRAVADRRVKERLPQIPAASAAVLLPLLDKSLAAQEETIAAMEARRTSNEDAMHAEEARGLDAKLDKLLSLLDQTLDGFVELFEGIHAEQARKLREALFPDGVIGITRRPFVEQHELVSLLLRKLRSAELAGAVAILQLGFWVDRLQQLNTAYGAALTRPDRVDLETVRALDTAAWLAHVEVVAAIIALHPSNQPKDIEARQLLLQPIVEQEEEAAMLRARRRNGTPDGQPLDPAPDPLDEPDDLDEGTLEPDDGPEVALATET